jgi:uncharacterized protein (DUF488 family)
MTPPPAVYTIGHGDRPLEELVECLRSFEVGVVADVRSWPGSRRHPRFDRDSLEAALARHGLRYRWLGEGLGGLRPEGYEAHMQTRVFAEALRVLLGIVPTETVALLCAERDPAACHRRHIAAALVAAGCAVHHIDGPGRLFPAQPTLFPL